MNREAIPVNLGRLVGLVGPGAWALYGAYAVTYMALAFLTLPRDGAQGPILLALGVILVAGGLVAAPSSTPLPWWRVACVWGAVVVSTTAGSIILPFAGLPALEAWFLGANSFLLFATALRGRIIGAWAGMTIMIGIVLIWSMITTGAIFQGLAIVYGQPVALLAGTFFSLGLHTTAQRIAEYAAAQARAAAVEAHETEARRHREAEIETLRTSTEPTLRAIAAGQLSADDRRSVEILEATLRDRIRGSALAQEPLVSAVLDLRRRGADVLLLDDLGTSIPSDVDIDALLFWAADQLAKLDVSDTTVRLTREGSEYVVTITTEDADLRQAVK